MKYRPSLTVDRVLKACERGMGAIEDLPAAAESAIEDFGMAMLKAFDYRKAVT